MPTRLFISTLLVFTLVSCNNSRTQDKPKQETPKALEDKSSYEIVSKRGYDNLVENLYNEIVSKDVELKKLEEKIDDLNSSKSDSIEPFDKVNEKIQSYFRSTDRNIAQINDSLLRDKMKLFVAGSLTKYNSQTAKHNELLKTIAAKELTISDLHIVLKIVKTLPFIEKYQKNNLPDTKPLEGFIRQQDQIINLADTLLKK